MIYTARKPPRYRKWTILASYHTVASASDYHCLSIFACNLSPKLGKYCDMTARAFVQRHQYCRAVDNRNTSFYV